MVEQLKETVLIYTLIITKMLINLVCNMLMYSQKEIDKRILHSIIVNRLPYYYMLEEFE